MKRVMNHVGRGVLVIGVVAALVIGAMQIPLDQWLAIGQRAAVVSVGLEHPAYSLSYVEQAMENQQTATPTVPVGNGTSADEAMTSVIPPKGDGGGAVEEHVLSGGIAVAEGVAVKNNSGVEYNFASLLESGLPFETGVTSEPQVLIVHTHACECYMSYFAGYYNEDDETRSANNADNVTAVGEAIAKELRVQGIGVIHDMTQHDAPEYTGAYTRSEQTILSYLQKYPSICVVLDIHRDAMQQSDLTKIKPTVTVNGRKAAQVMAVIGGTSSSERPNEYCEENLQLALSFHRAMEQTYAGIMRPLYVVDARYNQGLLAGSMLLEVGTDANTLSEALYSGSLVGKQLAGLLLSDS